ncbi:MAG: universal stress protein [Thermoanaerobaculia bacterium]
MNDDTTEPASAPEPRPLGTVVVAVSQSASSRRAVEWTSHLAAPLGSTVVAVHVLTFNEEFLKDGLTPDTMRTWRREREALLRDHWLRPLAEAGVDHSHRMVEANTIDEGPRLRSASPRRRHCDRLRSNRQVARPGHPRQQLRLTHHAQQPSSSSPRDGLR